jgi:hypothetical protein
VQLSANVADGMTGGQAAAVGAGGSWPPGPPIANWA